MKIGISMNADSGHLIFALHRSLVECFNIVQLVDEFEHSRIYFSLGKSVKHEGVVAIRTMSYTDCLFRHHLNGLKCDSSF